MAIRIEILAATENSVTAAFYFPIPIAKQSLMAADAARVPAGKKLTTAEIQDLRDGKLVEIVQSISATGFDTTAVRQALRDTWQELRPLAENTYSGRYRWVGDTWTDVSGWVNG